MGSLFVFKKIWLQLLLQRVPNLGRGGSSDQSSEEVGGLGSIGSIGIQWIHAEMWADHISGWHRLPGGPLK
jgi:hypothetical protein